jgi:hypothetical protein
MLDLQGGFGQREVRVQKSTHTETPTEMNDEARRIAEVLEIAAPEQARADELQQWVSWWKASYEAAPSVSDEQKHYLKGGDGGRRSLRLRSRATRPIS